MYATAGLHPYVLPGGILHDVTDRGPLWDPVKNLYSFTYNYQSDRLRVFHRARLPAPTCFFLLLPVHQSQLASRILSSCTGPTCLTQILGTFLVLQRVEPLQPYWLHHVYRIPATPRPK